MNNDVIQAKQVVYRLLKYRDRTRKEIEDKLTQKGIAAHVVAEVVAYFNDCGLIDHHKFAQMWIRSRQNRSFGISRIKRELREKGIEPEIIEQEIAAVSQADELQNLLSLAQHKMDQCRKINPLKAKQRIYGYLMRRGFSCGAVMKALKEIE